MAFKPFQNDTPSLPEVPFLNNYPNLKKRNGECFDVSHVLESEKGIILFTSEFKVFLWTNEKAVNAILNCLLAASVGSEYSQIQVMLDPTVKKLCHVGIEDGVFKWESDGKVWTRVESTSQTSLPNLSEFEAVTEGMPPAKKKR